MSRVTTCLWFGTDAERAVRFYVSLLPGSSLTHVQRSPADWPGGKAGRRDPGKLHSWRSELSSPERRLAC